ncbi:hypothetical protein Pint_12111 [Pistacia integerrima]|uniref:Uncharacterized protein n=1 Tax=Pistacia integerrima TaxID=434235 RepID=A0ACC0XII9_9ROSI|nr:hypothetical protein Pint_12111 [Pistacia integerrima]
MYAEELMAVRDENSIHDPEPHIIRIEETVVDSTNIAPQVPNKVEKNGDSTQKTLSPHQLSGENYGKVDTKICVALYRAALKGDWATAEVLLGQDRSLLCGRITKNGETVLHIAAGAKQIGFVEKLLELIEPQDLTLKDRNGNSAFCFAVAAGAIQIAENMLKKNEKLLATRGGQDVTPIYLAAIFGYRDMTLYLYRKAKFNGIILSRDDKGSLFFACLSTGLYDLAIELLKDLPELAMACDKNQDTALHILARQPSSFAGRKGGLSKPLITSIPGTKFNHNTDSISTQALELVRRLWDILLEQGDLEHTDLKFVLDAARFGNFEFLNELIRRYPDLIHEIDENNHSIFHIAVMHRHANIFNLIFEIGFTKDVMATLEDNDGNNILHLAAKLPHPNRVNIVPSAALQMQRELLWFKEVEKVVQPSFREKKNKNGQTPQELFTQEHKELLSNGESWMKNTTSSCILVATIIATVIFATLAEYRR